MANNSFKRGTYKKTNFTIKGLHFSKIYTEQRLWVKYLLVIATGIFLGITGHFFIFRPGGYSYGLSCLVQGIARFTSYEVLANNPGMSPDLYNTINTGLYWGLIFVANIPLFIFSRIKIGKRFTLLSLTFTSTSTIVGFLLGITPVLKDLNIFGSTALVGSASWIENINKFGIAILPFSPPGALIADYDPSNFAKPFFLMLSTSVYALSSGAIFGIVYIIGGSTAGTDFISVYISKTKNKPIASVFFFVNIFFLVTGATLGAFVPAALACPECRSYEFFFSANLIGTITSLGLFTWVFGRFFPRSKKYKVEVNSKKISKIQSALKSLEYPHPTNILKLAKDYTVLNTVCSAMELSLLFQTINNVDDDATVIVSNVAYYGGKMDTYQLGSD